MKKSVAALLLLFFASCQYFEKQIPSEKELLEQELKKVDWNKVDEYPTVADCDSLTDANLRKQCFFEYLTSTIQQKLNVDTPLNKLYPEIDTIQVKVTVSPDASLQFEPQFPNDSVAYNSVKIDSILQARLVDLPKVHPAIKRGVPVKTQFILPVILKVE
jgi:hypothetical protein